MTARKFVVNMFKSANSVCTERPILTYTLTTVSTYNVDMTSICHRELSRQTAETLEKTTSQQVKRVMKWVV